MVSAWS